VSRGKEELLTAPKPRGVSLLSVCPTVKPVGEPDASLIGHVRFDERGWETEHCRMAQVPRPSSTLPFPTCRVGLLMSVVRGRADVAGR
jgi:hypothetical protein